MSEAFDAWQARIVNACVSSGMMKQAKFMTEIRDLLAEAFIAGQEQSTGFTGVDMANAAADGFRDGKANVVVDLSKHHGGQHLPGTERMFLSDVIAAIEAAGGSVKK